MSDCSIDTDQMMPVDSIEGGSTVDTNLLREMAIEAYEFMCEQEWCERVDHQYLAYGVGGVVAVFLFQITPRSEDVDPWLWVIVGDLPPAYIVVDDNPTAADALDAYCSEIQTWVEAAERGESVDDLIPVNAPPTLGNAEQLNGRLEFLRSKILPLVKAC
ncbi:MAG TPA: hypothetical protein VGE83_11220 [Terracidiphilus sp.]|jgi:hypothetical protein